MLTIVLFIGGNSSFLINLWIVLIFLWNYFCSYLDLCFVDLLPLSPSPPPFLSPFSSHLTHLFPPFPSATFRANYCEFSFARTFTGNCTYSCSSQPKTYATTNGLKHFRLGEDKNLKTSEEITTLSIVTLWKYLIYLFI